MAVKCAEVMSLRRAFDVSLPTVEERWDSPPEPVKEIRESEVAAAFAPPPTPKAAIEKAREALQPDPVVTKVQGTAAQREIRSRMTAPGVTREMRDEFKNDFGPVDNLTPPLTDEALQWVKDRTSEIEPF